MPSLPSTGCRSTRWSSRGGRSERRSSRTGMASTGDDDVISVESLRTFVDASVLIPAAISGRRSARDLLEAGQRGETDLVVSQDVLDEAERNLYRKRPDALRTFWAQRDQLRMVNPSQDVVVDVARQVEAKDA